MTIKPSVEEIFEDTATRVLEAIGGVGEYFLNYDRGELDLGSICMALYPQDDTSFEIDVEETGTDNWVNVKSLAGDLSFPVAFLSDEEIKSIAHQVKVFAGDEDE